MKKFYFILIIALSITQLTQAQLSGEYTISQDATQNPDYENFSDAIEALTSDGVQGSVTFKVMPGTYNEFLDISEISTLFDDNQVVFEGMGNDNQQVVLTEDAGYLQKPIIKIAAVKNVTFKNMKVTTTSNNYGNLVVFENEVHDITFDNVYFEGIEVSTSTYNNDKHIVYDNSDEVPNSNLHFFNCSFINGYMGISVHGINTLEPMDSNLIIKDCNFSNQYTKAIYATFQTDALINGNIIQNDRDIKDGFQAIDMYWTMNNTIIENNIINIDFDSKSGTGIELRPGIGETSPVIVRNNMVNITSNTTLNKAFAFSHSQSKNISIAHNTVFIKGEGSGSMIYSRTVIPDFTIQNNLFFNESNGYIYWFTKNDISGLNIDYNKIFFNGEYFARLKSDKFETLTNWSEINNQSNNSTIITNNPFISNSNLHINSSDDLTVANPLTYVTLDIDNETRSSSAPCAGADEYMENINLPPFVANEIEDIIFENNTESTTISLSNIFSDPDDDDSEIIIELVSNSNSDLVEATLSSDNREITIERMSSDEGTAVITLKANSNGQSIETSFNVVCNLEPIMPVIANQVEPIIFTQYPENQTIDLANTFEVPGYPDANISLSIENAENTHFETILNETNLEINRTSPEAFTNQTIVIRGTYLELYVDMTILVSGDVVNIEHGIATFEDVILNENGVWEPAQEGENFMISNSWKFYSDYHTTYWSGYTASNGTDTSLEEMDAQYTAVPGNGYNQSEKYGVAYTYGPSDVMLLDNESISISGCYVTNNLWAYNSIINGDGYSTPFGGDSGNDPDFFRLWAVGNRGNDQLTDTLFFYLADYRFENNDEDYVIDTWEWFDLSPLGEVKSVRFGLQSSKVNDWGMVTPAYFCLDDFNGIAPQPDDLPPYVENEIETVYFNDYPDNKTIDLTSTFNDMASPNEEIVITVSSNSNTELISATINNKTLSLERLSENSGTVSITLEANSNGLTVQTTFTVECITIVDLPPVVVNPFDEITINNFPYNIILSLANVVSDPDNDDQLISYSLVSNSHPDLISATVEHKQISIVRLAADEANVSLVLNAISNGQSVEFTITLNVLPPWSTEDVDTKFAVYPNPCIDYINVKTELHIQSYKIIDLSGSTIIQGRYENTISTHQLSSGIYQLVLIDDNNHIIKQTKFIKE